MTEIEQKAEEYIKKFEEQYAFADTTEADRTSKDIFISDAYKDGYKQGQQAKSLEVICKDCSIQKQISKQCDDLLKENAELKAELEKLKVCGSCKYVCYSAHEEPCIHCANCFACADKSHNKWELAE